MIKRYCDVCETPIERNLVSDRLTGQVDFTGPAFHNVKVKLELILGTNDEWNSGDVCLDCTRTAVNECFDEIKSEMKG